MSGACVNILVEGQTERNFVNQVLAPHLSAFQVWPVARVVETKRDQRRGKQHKGGLSKYEKARRDFIDWIKEEKTRSCYFSSMFDLYGLPEDFPGYEEARKMKDPYQKVDHLEKRLQEDLQTAVPPERMIPYIQLHEFETLIFAEPAKLGNEFLDDDHQAKIQEFVRFAEQHQSPERINDGLETAPSKRITQALPSFKNQKSTAGVNVVADIGLDVLRGQCPHFNEWVTKLEQLKLC